MATRNDQQQGPFVYQNWMAALDDENWRGTAEVDLYTDAHVVGQLRGDDPIDLGPYQVLNVVGHQPEYGKAKRHLVLRYDDHSGVYFRPDPAHMGEETDESAYHGGGHADEFAALLALSLGIRIEAGSISRTFEPDGDSKGKPESRPGGQRPRLPTGIWGTPVLPRTTGRQPLSEADPLQGLPDLPPEDAVALVRAARLYQQGVWMAEAEPEMAWLLLVSAVETAADHHFTDDAEAVQLFRDRKADLSNRLEELGGTEAVEAVAEEFAMVMQGTKKFIDLCLEYKPNEPDARPPEGSRARIRWSRTGFRENLSTIYGYRSRALHAGTPFPAPMCRPPLSGNEWEAPAETPVGLRTAARGGVWVQEDVPMNLHTFEYIARRVLANWWESL